MLEKVHHTPALNPGMAIDPAVALADKALETGSVDKLNLNVLTECHGKRYP